MKKISSIFFLLLFCLSVQAQIQRHFWGLELGRSTKADVKSFIISEGLEYDDDFGGLNAIGITDLRGLPFAGYSWGVTFVFYNNTLFKIQMVRTNMGFSMTTGETYEIDTKSIFHELRGKLNNKYGNLEKLKLKYSEPHFSTRDNSTNVELIYGEGNIVILQYYDSRLGRMNQNGDDL